MDLHRVPVRTSIGIAEFKEGMSITQFVESADQALYRAKEKGKDRIESAE